MDSPQIITKTPRTVLELYSELALLIAQGHGNAKWESYGGDLEIVDHNEETIATFHEP